MKILYIAIYLNSTVVFSQKYHQTKSIMHNLKTSIEVLLPLSFKHSDFTKKSNKKMILSSLKGLASSSANLKKHFNYYKKTEYGFLANSIAQRSKDALNFYNNEEYYKAKFILQNLSTHCVSCHTKVSSHSVNRISPLFDKLKLMNVSGYNLAHYNTTVRNYDKSVSIYERELISEDILNEVQLTKYLIISLRVKTNPQRVIKFFRKLATKKNFLSKLQLKQFKTFISQLKTLHSNKVLNKSSLPSAKKLLNIVDNNYSQIDTSTKNLINLVSASTILHNQINQTEIDNTKKSEACYLIGMIDEALQESIWLSETQVFLETSIKLAPKSKWAVKAYDLLLSQFVFGYTGSSGTNIPVAIKRRLKDLQKLIGINRRID